MIRRRLLLVAVIGVVVLLGIGPLLAWRFWPTQSGTAITVANEEKIERGMSVAEVEAILGGPARNDSSGPLNHGLTVTTTDGVPAFEREWRSDEAIIVVLFDAGGRVIASGSVPTQPLPQPSLVDRAPKWLGL